jgi:recombination protein RecT
MTQVSTQQQQTAVVQKKDIKSLLASESIQKRFQEILKDKAPGFISSILNVVNSNTNFRNVDPNSVIMAAAQAAALDLPVNPNLGLFYIIPYGGTAQAQLGYKGLIQLAKRGGQILKMNALEIRAGQLKKANPLTEEFEFDFEVGHDAEVIGFVAYFKEVGGFEKMIYWNVAKMNAHAKRHSKTFNSNSSPWKTDYIAMGKKTLLKEILSKYSTLSIEMQHAIKIDQAVVNDFEGSKVEYVDHEDVTDQAAIAETATTTEANTNAGNGATVNIPSADNL